MEEGKSDRIQTVVSKTGLKVPLVNNIHIHSAYDPIKEAENLVKQSFSEFKNGDYVLVLGLGFGYHVIELIKEYERNHLKVSLFVIEPSEEMYELCIRNNPDILHYQVQILHGSHVKTFYENRDFVNFLIHRPSIFKLSSIFNLHQNFFKSLLGYKASTKMEDIQKIIEDEELKSYANEVNQQEDLLNYVSNLKNSNIEELTQFDLLLLSLNSISKFDNKSKLSNL